MKTVLITGGAGNISYALASQVASGSLLGDEEIELRLFDIARAEQALQGAVMELEDCCSTVTTKVIGTIDPETAFKNIDVAIFVGGFPRLPGMKRSDLLEKNAEIFKQQGEYLQLYAKNTCLCVVIANPCNTNMTILASQATKIPLRNFTSLSRLDLNRARGMIARKMNRNPNEVHSMLVWGNHSSTQVASVEQAWIMEDGVKTPVNDIVDQEYIKNDFIADVAGRGAAVLQTRGASSATSAARAILDHTRDWMIGTKPGEFTCMGIITDGLLYGLPAGIAFSLPVVCLGNGEIKVVDNLKLPDWIRAKLNLSAQELVQEKSQAAPFLTDRDLRNFTLQHCRIEDVEYLGVVPFEHKPIVLADSIFNKDLGFTMAEREALGITAFLPPRVETLEEQVQRCHKAMEMLCPEPLQKFVYLRHLSDTNENLFYAVLQSRPVELLPIVYTPIVGAACVNWSTIWPNHSRGLYLNKSHKGRIRYILQQWPRRVDGIVVSDGSRILGLGDIGSNGMGIPIGKGNLIVAGGTFDPAHFLPIMFDLGTRTEKVRDDPLYLGLREEKLSEVEILELMDEFVDAIFTVWPHVLLQWEDFSNDIAFTLLNRYRLRRTFNDDIQGTGCVVTASMINSVRLSGIDWKDHKFLFFGAGSAGVGVADVIASELAKQVGISFEEARKHFYLFDSKGLVSSTRGGRALAQHKIPYAHGFFDHECPTFEEAVEMLKPTALVGLGTIPDVFTKEIVESMCDYMPETTRPIIFALSNPTSKIEITSTNAVNWSNGRAIYASGSPQPVVELNGVKNVPSQANNFYVFPGIAFGAALSGASTISDEVFVMAAEALADMVTEEDLAVSSTLPDISNIKSISAAIAARISRFVVENGLSTVDLGWPEDGNLDKYLEIALERQWSPKY
ncbi:hypothetical protein PCE1_002300 [Barthelona sp. PCE]